MKPKRRAPASAAASLTMMLTGVPVRASIDPACAEKASGISIRDGAIPARAATTTTIGSSAATAPLTLMSAVSTATRTPMTTSSDRRPPPPWVSTCWPAQAVTPVESSASPTTNRVAMKITVGSLKPASAWSRSSSPVRNSDSDTPIATTPSGIRLDMNARTARTRISRVSVTEPMAARRRSLSPAPPAGAHRSRSVPWAATGCRFRPVPSRRCRCAPRGCRPRSARGRARR